MNMSGKPFGFLRTGCNCFMSKTDADAFDRHDQRGPSRRARFDNELIRRWKQQGGI
jgi:hypothetical protein